MSPHLPPAPYDLVIVGSGGAGFAAAIAARRRGLEVVMIEHDLVGGTCVNTGCVPSKALLAAAEARQVALDDRFPGVRTSAGRVDMSALAESKREVIAGLQADKYVDLANRHGWKIVRGSARFRGEVDRPLVEVRLADGRKTIIRAQHYLVATGSLPSARPIDGLAEAGYLTSTTAMELESLPGTMVVMGGNAVGLEQAQLFARLGVNVTLVETLDRLAPYEEPEVSRAVEAVFADEGITIRTGVTVDAVERDDRFYSIRLDAGEPELLEAERLLVATGRRPATDGLDLDTVGVKVGDRGEVVVDDYLRTANPRIWAGGDVTGHVQFVYVAAAHGGLIVENAFDQAARVVDYGCLPRVTFTTPAIASVGLTDAQASEQAVDCECRVVPLDQVPRAIVNRDTRGVIKLVAERRTALLRGIHVVGDGAADTIQAGVYALQAGMTTQQLANSWAPYLTMSEGLKLAAQSFSRDVANLSCCAS